MLYEQVKRVILIMFFFSLGLNKFILYLPFFILFIALNYKEVFSPDYFLKLKPFFIFTVLIFSVICIVIFGGGLLLYPYRSLVVMGFAFFGAGVIFYQSLSKRSLILSYLFGVFVECCVIIFASYIKGGYGHGGLWSPFSGSVINSPLVSSMMSIFGCVSYYVLCHGKLSVKGFIFLVILLVSILSGFYLKGRAFFIIFFLGSLYSHLFLFIKGRSQKGLSLFALLMVTVFLFYLSSQEFRYEFLHVVGRFKEGLDSSSRGELYINGFLQMLSHPLGGFGVDEKFVSVKWFHNFWIDSARIGGWAPIVLFFSAYAYLLRRVKVNILCLENALEKLIILASLAVMFQEVIIEGDYRPYFILFLGSLTLLKNHNYDDSSYC